MALQKPSISECIDGKGHIWMIVAEEGSGDNPADRLEHRWCKKCGSLTQVGFDADNQAAFAVDEDGEPHLAIPRILDALIK